MKLWLVSRPIDEVGYDEYDAVLVRADTADAALDVIRETRWMFGDKVTEMLRYDRRTFPLDHVTVIEVTADGEPGVIIHSFNAG